MSENAIPRRSQGGGDPRSPGAAAAASPVVISGMGAVSAVGTGCEALWNALSNGQDGIRPIRRFATGEFAITNGAMVPGWDTPAMETDPYDSVAFDLCVRFATDAAREAWEAARLGLRPVRAERIGCVLGTSLGKHRRGLHAIADTVAGEIGMSGPRLTVSTACASSTNAIGLACHLLRSGDCDVVLAGGVDVLLPEIFAGFHALGVLSSEKCAPFSAPAGTTLGEGAGFVVLELQEHARRRGVEPSVAMLGYGLSGDAFHETSPDPTGNGVARAIRGALADAALEPGDVGYVNVHGTGTEANDPAEWRALQRVFGERAAALPLSSTKSILGHAQGAAGVLELIATLVARQHGTLPQTLHFSRPRPRGPTDPIAQNTPRSGSYRYAVSTNSAFGGANAAVVIGSPRSIAGRPGRKVEVLGVGAITGLGVDLDALRVALEQDAPRCASKAAPFPLERVVPTADPRNLDPATRYLTASAALALRDGGLRIRGSLRERAGIVVGTTRVSPRSEKAFRRSVERRGLARLSAPAFARMVLNASTGSAAKLLSLRGPTSTITTGGGSGLAAIVYAAELLAHREDADYMIAGATDELAEEASPDEAEGAACVVLGVAGDPDPSAPKPSVTLAGWATAGPGDVTTAVRNAIARSGNTADRVDALFGAGVAAPQVLTQIARALDVKHPPGLRIDPTRSLGHGAATTSTLAFVAAVLALRERRARCALVIANESGTATTSIVLTNGEPT